MKAYFTDLFTGIFLVFLISCRSVESPAPTQPLPVTPGTSTSGQSQSSVATVPTKPVVITASMSGVPDQNILIDTLNKTITVSLPENYAIGRPTMTLITTCTACVTGNYPSARSAIDSDFYDIRGESANRQVSFFHDAVYAGTTYQVIIKPTGTFGVLAEQLPSIAESYDLTVNPSIYVRNFLDGQQTQLTLTHQQTAQSFQTVIRFCPAPNACQDQSATRIYIVTGPLPPGDYTGTFRKADGRRLTVTGLLRVIRGKPQYAQFVYCSPGSKEQCLTGWNLYDAYKPEILLSNVKGYTGRVAVSGYDEQTRLATIQLPAGLQPGVYRAKGLSTAGSFNVSTLYIPRFPGQPTLMAVYGAEQIGNENSDTLVLWRGSHCSPYTYWFSSLYKQSVVLTSVDKGTVVEVPVYAPKEFISYGYDGGSPFFAMPATLPTGRYWIHWRMYTTDTAYLDSEPLNQVIVIR